MSRICLRLSQIREEMMDEVPENLEELNSEEDTPFLRIYIEIQFTTADPCYRSRLMAPLT